MGARPRLRRWRPGRAVPLPADLGAELERVFGLRVRRGDEDESETERESELLHGASPITNDTFGWDP